MKKKLVIISPIILIIVLVSFLLINNDNKNEVVMDNKNKLVNKNNGFLTIMLEQDDGTYKETTNIGWPGDDYVFNSEMSRCENGGELSWDNTNKIVKLSGVSADSCYVYFDIYNPPKLADYIIENEYVTDGENDLYYHDGAGTYGSLEAGDDSYKYAGANPNNYICFGSDVTPCPSDNLYRIIGLFDDENDGLYSAKLIKADYVKSSMLGTDGNYSGAYSDISDNYKGSMSISEIAAYQWNTNNTNNWSTSSLNTVNLNNNYWNYLSNDWQDLIETTTWYLRGHDTSAETPKSFYNFERNGDIYGNYPTTYTDEIGLPYPSDYGFAASPTYWSTNIGSYTSARNNNWLYLGLYEWTITPVTGASNRLYYFNINGSENGASANSDYTLRPTFYLKSDVTYKAGNGSQNNPYTVNLTVAQKPKINNVTVTNITKDSITVSVDAVGIDGEKDSISQYFYSINNGEYVSSSSNAYAFNGLTSGTTYTIRVYVVDNNNVQSSTYTINTQTDSGVLLADYIKGLYTSQGSNGIYYHTSSLANSAGDNSYRYAGANPNNYVCFGSDAATCPSENMYRIIGVFDNQVKLIKSDYANSNLLGTDGSYHSDTYTNSSSSYYKGSLTTINRYDWNNSTGNNAWSESKLNTINLNQNYINNIENTWSSLIATYTWKAGGGSLSYLRHNIPKIAYNYEIGANSSSTTYSAKIGLMYVSDYYYGASPTYWTYPGFTSSSYPDADGNYGSNYDYRAAISSNWIHMGLIEWTISRNSNYSYSVFAVMSTGEVNSTGGIGNYFYAVRPCFYLNSNVTYVSGSGTSSDPFRIS